MRLPGGLHRDPADRIVVALSRRRGVPPITRDEKLRSYPYVQTLWWRARLRSASVPSAERLAPRLRTWPTLGRRAGVERACEAWRSSR